MLKCMDCDSTSDCDQHPRHRLRACARVSISPLSELQPPSPKSAKHHQAPYPTIRDENLHPSILTDDLPHTSRNNKPTNPAGKSSEQSTLSIVQQRIHQDLSRNNHSINSQHEQEQEQSHRQPQPQPLLLQRVPYRQRSNLPPQQLSTTTPERADLSRMNISRKESAQDGTAQL